MLNSHFRYSASNIVELTFLRYFERWQGNYTNHTSCQVRSLFNDNGEKQTFRGEVYQVASELCLPSRLRVGRNQAEKLRTLLFSAT